MSEAYIALLTVKHWNTAQTNTTGNNILKSKQDKRKINTIPSYRGLVEKQMIQRKSYEKSYIHDTQASRFSFVGPKLFAIFAPFLSITRKTVQKLKKWLLRTENTRRNFLSEKYQVCMHRSTMPLVDKTLWRRTLFAQKHKETTKHTSQYNQHHTFFVHARNTKSRSYNISDFH